MHFRAIATAPVGIPMLEVEPHNGHNGQRDHTATGSGQNGRPGHIVSPASGRYRVSFRVVLLIFRSRDASSIIRSSGRPGGANVGTIRVSVATVHYIRLPAGRIHTRNSQHSVCPFTVQASCSHTSSGANRVAYRRGMDTKLCRNSARNLSRHVSRYARPALSFRRLSG